MLFMPGASFTKTIGSGTGSGTGSSSGTGSGKTGFFGAGFGGCAGTAFTGAGKIGPPWWYGAGLGRYGAGEGWW